jgi:hypothetical protein
MKKNYLYTTARILLGLMFTIFGLNGFLHFIPNPPSIPAPALAFYVAMIQSHFSYFVFAVQLVAGILLLLNRYVALAIVALAGVIANIFAFHVTMWPQSLVPMPIVALVLWFAVAWSQRDRLVPLLFARS